MPFPIGLALAGLGMGGGLLKGIFGGGGLTGHREKFKQVPRFTPEQQTALSSLLGQGMQNTDFGNIENLARTNFQTQTVPSLAERFTSMGGLQGTGGTQRSSGFQDALGRAGAGLEQNLAGMRSQFGMQQLGMGLQPRFENAYSPRQAGGLEQALGGLMGMAPMAAMNPQMFGLPSQGLLGGQQTSNVNLQQLMQMLPFIQNGGLQSTQAYQ